MTRAGSGPDDMIPAMRVAPPGPASQALLARLNGALYPGTQHSLAPFVVARKASYWVEDVDGNRFLDMLSGMGSVPLGSVLPAILDPAVKALARYGLDDSHYYPTEPMIELTLRLLRVAPQGLTRADLALNGTEAVETAVRAMRHSGRPVIIAFMGSFHGESTAAAALGAEASQLSRGVRGMTPGFVHVPYPGLYRTPFGEPRRGGSGDATVDYIRDYVLFHVVDPRDVAGVLIEPILGSGGVISPPATFWAALRSMCDEYGWLLCLDEVKTGFGRTGSLFAADRFGVRPDLLCLGKAMGGGILPIGALLGTEAALGSFDDLSTGSTWSWMPAACAAALATLDLFEDGSVVAHVRAMEHVAQVELAALRAHSHVGDVRVVGAFIAIEFVADRSSRARAPTLQAAVADACLQRGILGDSSSSSFNLQPSLATPLEVLERGLRLVVETALEVLPA